MSLPCQIGRELQLSHHSDSLLFPSEVTLALVPEVLRRSQESYAKPTTGEGSCLDASLPVTADLVLEQNLTQFSKAAPLHLAMASQVWSPWRLPASLVDACTGAPSLLLLSSLSPQPCPAPCWEARTNFRKRKTGLCSGNFCFWPSNPPVLKRRDQQRPRRCVGKGSGEGTW